uniref:Uncharacterized protein n=1 Tax=Rhizophagus irregularis (strain DAOM 181602 / DAOM 197198 / MUCL 43194) TaxID=747089 RepID=U9SX12_RHIID
MLWNWQGTGRGLPWKCYGTGSLPAWMPNYYVQRPILWNTNSANSIHQFGVAGNMYADFISKIGCAICITMAGLFDCQKCTISQSNYCLFVAGILAGHLSLAKIF